MSRRFLTAASVPTIMIAAALAPAPVAGQSAAKSAATKAWTAPRMPDGQPDLQGMWDYGTITPMERPIALGTKAFFDNDAEAVAWERNEKNRLDRDRIDAEGGSRRAPSSPTTSFGSTAAISWGPGARSLIVDPPDGRLPALTPEGEKRADRIAAERARDQLGPPPCRLLVGPAARRSAASLGQTSGPPMTPGRLQQQFPAVPDSRPVVIVNEMIHEVRVIPMDGRPHLHIPQWMGDSRGHWEGDTLVVDTTNFKRKTSLPGSGANLHLVERFTRADPDTLDLRVHRRRSDHVDASPGPRSIPMREDRRARSTSTPATRAITP